MGIESERIEFSEVISEHDVTTLMRGHPLCLTLASISLARLVFTVSSHSSEDAPRAEMKNSSIHAGVYDPIEDV